MTTYNRAALLNAPPRLSDLPPDAKRVALVDRHHANQAAWFAIHERAGLSLGDRIRRAVRQLFNRRTV